MIDPHTAVGYHCYETYINDTHDETKTIIVSTASPYKFSGAVLDALGLEKTNDLLKDIQTLQALDNDAYDKRLEPILTQQKTTITTPLKDALSFVKKVIGDIDDHH